MKDKKAHEVSNILNFLLPKLAKHSTNLILDIGCGKGYTSYALAAANPAVRIHGIDSSKANIREFAKRIKNIASVHRERISGLAEDYVSRFSLKTLFVGDKEIGGIEEELEGSEAMLMTLHGCGDLSSTLVRMFVSLKRLKHLLLISCCFNLLSEQITEEAKQTPFFNLYSEHARNDLTLKAPDCKFGGGFPTSEHMYKTHRTFFLGRVIRCAAAASFAFLVEEPQRGLAFSKMLYRAALEVCVCYWVGVYEGVL